MKKHIIEMTENEDGYINVYLDGQDIEEYGWDYSYCEHPYELADAIEIIFKRINGEPFEIVRKR